MNITTMLTPENVPWGSNLLFCLLLRCLSGTGKDERGTVQCITWSVEMVNGATVNRWSDGKLQCVGYESLQSSLLSVQ